MKKILASIFGLLVVFYFFGKVVGNRADQAVESSHGLPVEQVASVPAPVAGAVAEDVVTPVQFDYTVSQFAKNLGAASSKLTGKNVKPPRIAVKKSDVADHFEVKVRPDVTVIGVLSNETRHLVKVSIIIGRGYSDVNATMLMGLLMMAVSPNSTAGERGAAFKSLTAREPSAIVDNARYTLSMMEGDTVLTAVPY